jgi:hypothetical protein
VAAVVERNQKEQMKKKIERKRTPAVAGAAFCYAAVTHFSKRELFYPTPCGLRVDIPRNRPLKLSNWWPEVSCKRCKKARRHNDPSSPIGGRAQEKGDKPEKDL